VGICLFRCWLAAILFCGGFAASASGKVLILDYHTFLGTGRSSMDYSLQEFGSQLDRMRSLGWQLVSLEQALAGNLSGDKNIAITIDDGHRTVYDAVVKVLLPREVPAELFVFPHALGRSLHYLKVGSLKQLMLKGMGVGAHGYYHLLMTPKAWARNPKSVMQEALRPADALLQMTGKSPTLFAYPYGIAAPEAEASVQAAGYLWGFLADGRLRSVDLTDPKLNHFAVPRTIVYRTGLKALFTYLKSAP
jgi:peptidoglycan/xylan/chitin deacetylase (PgdA/CDA1 family)